MACAHCGAETGEGRDDPSLCEACEQRHDWFELIEMVQAGAAAPAPTTPPPPDAALPADPFRDRQTITV